MLDKIISQKLLHILLFGVFLIATYKTQGQVMNMGFSPPFRSKHSQWFNAPNNEIEVISVGGFGDLVINTNQARKSETISSVDLNSLFFIDYQTAFVVGNGGEILLTENHAVKWKKQISGTEINLESIFCLDRKKCWIVGDKEGLLLIGGIGKPWTQEKIIGEGRFNDLYFVDENHGYIVGDEGLFLKTTDGGEKWERISIPFKLEVTEFITGLPQLESIRFLDSEQGCVAGWDIGTGVVACTKNGGNDWNITKLDGVFTDIIMKDNAVFLIGEYGKIFRSQDFGKNWLLLKRR